MAKKWTAKEHEQFLAGVIPEGKDISQCRDRARKNFHKYWKPGVGLTDTKASPREYHNAWTEDELELLRQNKIVPGRTLGAARNKAFKIGVETYAPLGGKASKPHPEELCRKIAEEVAKTRNCSRVGQKYGINRETVRSIAKRFGVVIQPGSRDKIGEHIEYLGKKWVWSPKGYWRCTTKGRMNLTHILFEIYNGQKLPKDHCVFFKDGNRFNLTKENLVAMTKSEFGKKKYNENPQARAMIIAAGCLGRLNQRIKETMDPEAARQRCQKAAESRKPKQLETARKAAETRRQNAMKRGYYFTPEAIKRMSEAHKGLKYNRRKKNG